MCISACVQHVTYMYVRLGLRAPDMPLGRHGWSGCARTCEVYSANGL